MYIKFFLFSITIGLLFRLLFGLVFDIYGIRNSTTLALYQTYLEQELQGITGAIERIQSFENDILLEEITAISVDDSSILIVPKLYQQEIELAGASSFEKEEVFTTAYRKYLQNGMWILIGILFITLCIGYERKKNTAVQMQDHPVEPSIKTPIL